MPGAHPALGLPEVLFEVFQHLSPFPPHLMHKPGNIERILSFVHLPNRRTLVSAALTCRAFAEPASQVLWAVLYRGIEPLFHPLPAFKRVRRDGATRRDRIGYVLEGDITAAEWDRWEHCLSRVRCLVADDIPNWTLEPPFLPILLRQTNGGEPLLLNLQALALRDTGGDPIKTRVLRALVPRSLSSLSLKQSIRHHSSRDDLPRPSEYVPMDLQRIADISCNIRHFYIPGPLLSYPITLRSFPKLRTVHINRVSRNVYYPLVYQLRDAKELQEFTIVVSINDVDPHPSATNGEDEATENEAGDRTSPHGGEGFSALRRLSVRGMHTEITLLLRSIHSPGLRNVSLSSTQPGIADAMVMLSAFPSAYCAASLCWLHISMDFYARNLGPPAPDSGYVDRTEPALPGPAFLGVFAPLLHLHVLESLGITSRGALLSVADHDLDIMRRAWPRIRRLSLIHKVDANFHQAHIQGPVTRPSLPAIVNFVESRPALEYLDMSIESISLEHLEALEVHAASVEREGGPRQTQFMHFVLARFDHCFDITIPDIDRVARALVRIFPFLEGPGDVDDCLVRGRPISIWWTYAEQETDAYKLMERLNEV